MTVREDILNGAADLICGDRAEMYGPIEINFARIAALWSVTLTVNHERACSANSFATIVVEYNGFFAFGDQLVVQDVEHLEERCLVGDLIDDMVFKITLDVWASLAPNTQSDVF
jgi:hypothetical protein